MVILSFSLRIEVADFNFEQEESPEMQSFYDRLHVSITQYWSKRRENGETPYLNISSH